MPPNSIKIKLPIGMSQLRLRALPVSAHRQEQESKKINREGEIPNKIFGLYLFPFLNNYTSVSSVYTITYRAALVLPTFFINPF